MSRCFFFSFFFIFFSFTFILFSGPRSPSSFTDYYHYNYCCHISLNLANVYDHAYNNNLGIEVYGLKTNNVDYNLDNR